LACFLVASPGFHSGIRFDLAYEAGSQKLGNDLLPSRGFRVFGGMRERSLRCDASDRIANCVSESLAGRFIGSPSRFKRRYRRHHREPRTGDEPAGPKNSTINLSAR
jgi:hypothetical protein